MIFAARRQYAAPTVYTLGGDRPEGMDTSGRDDCPPQRASLAQNLWREADGCVCKRPGFRVVKAAEVTGKVLWECIVGEDRFLCYKGENGYRLRRVRSDGSKEIDWGKGGCQKLGQGAIIYAPSSLIWIDGKGRVILVTPKGVADVSTDLSAVPKRPAVTDTILPIPLLRAGTSPTGKGRYVSPPNLLSPIVQESFVYNESDKEVRRNRFCLALSPQLMGTLPVDGNGSSSGLSAEDKAKRVTTLTASAKLEIRVTESDDYGNTVSLWKKKTWQASDNINTVDAAFWIQNIPDDLCYDGDDNVRITYYRNLEETQQQAAAVLSAACYTAFGVAGLKDRLFAASGQRIYYSGMDQPLYFGSLNYLDVGGEGEIRMLAGEDTVMTVLCTDGARRVEGRAETDTNGEYALDARFSVSAVLPSPRVISHRHLTAAGELLYFSEEGVCAVTPSGVLDERCVQLRSHRLQGLLSQENADDLRMCAKGDYLFIGGQKGMYLLDLQHKVKVNENAYSSHGYEGYYWTGLPVDCFTEGESLRFYSDGTLYEIAPSVYHDEIYKEGTLARQSIDAVWESVCIKGFKAKDCHIINLCYGYEDRAALRICYRRNEGPWEMLKDYNGENYAFRYRPFHYGLWNYGSLQRRSYYRRLNLRRVRSLRLRFQNDIYDQGFRLSSYLIRYK